MSRRGWLAGMLIATLLLGAVITGILFLRSRGVQERIHAYLERRLSGELAMPVRLGSVRFSLSPGRVDVRQAAVLDPVTGTPFLTLERLKVRLALRPLLWREVRIRSVSLLTPRLLVDDSPRRRELALGLLAGLSGHTGAGEARPIPVSVENGTIHYVNPGSGVAFSIEGLRARLRWETPGNAIASILGESRLSVAGRELGGIRLEVNGRATRDVLEVTRLVLSRGSSVLRLHGPVVTREEQWEADLSVVGELVLAELGPVLPGGGWDGVVEVDGRLFGHDGTPPTFEGTLDLADGLVGGLPVADAQALISARPGTIEMIALNGQVGGGRLSASGTYETSAARYRGRISVRNVALEEGFRILRQAWPLAGRVNGSLEGSGEGWTLEGLDLSMELTAERLRFRDGSREAQARLVGRATEGVLKVDPLILNRGGSQLSARGFVDFLSDDVSLSVTGTVADLEEDLWPRAVEGLGGRLVLSGTLGGPFALPRFSGEMRAQGLSFKRVRLDGVKGPVEVERGRISSRRLELRVGRSTGVLTGEARWPGRWHEAGAAQDGLTLSLKLEGKGRVEDLAGWMRDSLPVGGPFAFTVGGTGTPTSLAGSGHVNLPELRVGTERVESIRATVGFEGSQLTIRSLKGRHRGIPFEARGRLALSGSYSFTLGPVKLDFAALSLVPGLRGTAMLEARGAGILSRPRVEGELTVTDSALGDLEVGDGTLHFALDRGRWQWGLTLNNGLRGRGTAPLTLSGPFEAKLSAEDLDLTHAIRLKLPFPLTVRADGSATVQGDLRHLSDLTGQVDLTALRCTVRGTPCRLAAPARLVVAAGEVRTEGLDLAGPGLSVTVKGSGRPREGVELEFVGHAPFPLLAPWVSPVEDIRGTPEGRVSLTGPPRQLRVAGQADLRGVEIKLKPIPVWLSVADGAVTFDNDRVRYRLSTGATAGGKLEGQGSATREGTRWRHTLELRLDGARLEQFLDRLEAGGRWGMGGVALRANLAFQTGPGINPVRTMGGELSIVLSDGTLSHYPAVVRTFGILTSAVQPTLLPDLTRERMPYRRISADFTITNGVMETKNLLLDSEVVRVSGVGEVSLPEKAMDLRLGVRPLQVLERGIRRVPLLRRFLPPEQSLTVVYVDLEGRWDDPRASVVPVKSLSQTVEDLLLLLLRMPDRLLVPR
ncbi:MAG: AsmA-like C-terminal domain-containing protein [Candidatus Methylomirabilales bacterium]